MTRVYGFDLLRQQVLEFVDSEMSLMFQENTTGDSEIEKLLYMALAAKMSFCLCEYRDLYTCKDDALLERLLEQSNEPEYGIFIRPQAQIDDYRVDFLVIALDYKHRPARVWRRLVIECDGHQFHERTKEQAAKDRSRDRDLVMKGYEVFRFTGSELWRDPLSCADQIISWAVKSW